MSWDPLTLNDYTDNPLEQLKNDIESSGVKNYTLTEEQQDFILKAHLKVPEKVVNPDHYNRYDVEVLEMARRIWGEKAVDDFLKISAFKYRMRAGFKGDFKIDLQKEVNCLKLRKK